MAFGKLFVACVVFPVPRDNIQESIPATSREHPERRTHARLDDFPKTWGGIKAETRVTNKLSTGSPPEIGLVLNPAFWLQVKIWDGFSVDFLLNHQAKAQPQKIGHLFRVASSRNQPAHN